MMTSNFSLFEESSETEMNISVPSLCDEILSNVPAVLKSSEGFENAIEMLLNLEKLTRKAEELESNTRVLLQIVSICVELRRWKELNENLCLLANRKLMFKKSVASMIEHCFKVLESPPTLAKDIYYNLLQTLYGITEGKTYLEIQRAKLGKLLADYNERENNLEESIRTLEDLKCEGIANMETGEKVKLQLQLIRLLIAKEDYVKAQILSNRVSNKFLEESGQEELKLQFYHLKIQLDCRHDFLKTSKHYQAILDCYKDGDPEKLSIIGNMVLYYVLAPYDHEQRDLTENLIRHKLVKDCPLFKTLLSAFLSQEVINTKVFLAALRSDLGQFQVLNDRTSSGRHNWIEITNRLVEHNILVIAMYYSKIYMKRLGEILDIPMEECERFISRLVTSCRISAKIDRPAGIVCFTRVKQPNEVLTEWANDMDKLMRKVNNVFHMVNQIESCSGVENKNNPDEV